MLAARVAAVSPAPRMRTAEMRGWRACSRTHAVPHPRLEMRRRRQLSMLAMTQFDGWCRRVSRLRSNQLQAHASSAPASTDLMPENCELAQRPHGDGEACRRPFAVNSVFGPRSSTHCRSLPQKCHPTRRGRGRCASILLPSDTPAGNCVRTDTLRAGCASPGLVSGGPAWRTVPQAAARLRGLMERAVTTPDFSSRRRDVSRGGEGPRPCAAAAKMAAEASGLT